ncbi:MAG: hypothetical protein ACR2ML_04230 [Solirubrobacteraceae bacterium]
MSWKTGWREPRLVAVAQYSPAIRVTVGSGKSAATTGLRKAGAPAASTGSPRSGCWAAGGSRGAGGAEVASS